MRWGGAFAPNAGRPASMTRATGIGFRSPKTGPKAGQLRSGKHPMRVRRPAVPSRQRRPSGAA